MINYIYTIVIFLMISFPNTECLLSENNKGCHLYGKIKFVEYGEDYKVKFVKYVYLWDGKIKKLGKGLSPAWSESGRIFASYRNQGLSLFSKKNDSIYEIKIELPLTNNDVISSLFINIFFANETCFGEIHPFASYPILCSNSSHLLNVSRS